MRNSISMEARMEVLLTYKQSNVVVKIEEKDDSLSKLRQALLIAVDSHSGGSVDHSAAERCQFQRWSERWNCYVNIVSSDDIRANDKIVPLFKPETDPQVLVANISPFQYLFLITLSRQLHTFVHYTICLR